VSRLYLGIDGGQSSTTALICDEAGRVIGRGRAGSCNHITGEEAKSRFARAIGNCIREACKLANLNPDTIAFAAACLGLSGGAEDKAPFVRELIRSANYKITHDAEIALIGATAGQPGIIIIAGTGSIAFGRDRSGKSARAGGWGYVFGDEGGAFDLTRRALRAALRFEEGWGPPTSLRDRLLHRTDAATANDLLHRFYANISRSSIAALADVVTEAAQDGDPEAARILQDEASKLVGFVTGVYRQLFRPDDDPAIAYVGGVFKSPLLRQNFVDRARSVLGCHARPPCLSPAAGALMEALRLDGNGSVLSQSPAFDE